MRTLAITLVVFGMHTTAAMCQTTTSRLSRADLTATVGSFSANHTEVAEYGGWAHTFFGGLGAGYYWTDHLRSEIDVAWTSQGEVYGTESLRVSTDPFARAYTVHYYRDVNVSVAQAYQFGRNAWVHPFLSAGVDIDREKHETERPAQTLSIRSPGGAIVQNITLPALEQTETTVHARPFASAGFKAYLTDRAFFRAELKFGFGDRVERVLWKAGFGVDF